MANNLYTSPRLYASSYKPKYKTKRTAFEQGMGYTLEALPPGMSRAEFKKTYSEWERKLQNSGFDDIEYRSPSHTGHFTPFFRQNGSTATFMRMYDPAKEEYFRLATHFDSYMNELVDDRTRWSYVFRGKGRLYRTLWYLHIEGVPYRAIAKEFSGHKTKWTKGLKPIRANLIESRSVFWAHDNMQRILDKFWAWAKTYEVGYEDPRHD